MRFQAPDGLSFIQLDKRVEDGYAIFDVTASIEEFTGRNKSVIFTGCADFLRKLDEFDRKREGAVILEGTGQCQLVLSTFDSAGHMRVDVRVCRVVYQHLGGKAMPLVLEGGFPFDAEFANQIFRDLRELLRDCI